MAGGRPGNGRGMARGWPGDSRGRPVAGGSPGALSGKFRGCTERSRRGLPTKKWALVYTVCFFLFIGFLLARSQINSLILKSCLAWMGSIFLTFWDTNASRRFHFKLKIVESILTKTILEFPTGASGSRRQPAAACGSQPKWG